MENLDKALADLIEKISTTAAIAAPDVYQMLLKQLYISAAVDMLFLALIVAGICRLFWLSKNDKGKIWGEFALAISCLFLVFAVIVTQDILTLIFNQDYAVLKSAMKYIR